MSSQHKFGVHLRRTAENTDEITALTGRFGDAVGLTGVVGDLNRLGRRVRVPGRAPVTGFTWNEQDAHSAAWFPQGISTSADASADGRIDGRRMLITTWYSKRDEGCRITVVDLDSLNYRHILVVEPSTDHDGNPSFKPLAIHAGGIVWAGGFVHLAATAKGIFSCRLDDILRVDPAPATKDYRFVLPVRFAYRAKTDAGVTELRYSFLSLDRAANPPALITGEFGVPGQTTRLVRYPLDPTTMLLHGDEEGIAQPIYLNDGGVGHMQGAAYVDSTYYVTVSRGEGKLGYLFHGRPGALKPHRWALPPGPEDIAYWPQEDRLWSLTEYPGQRYVFAMDRAKLRLVPRGGWRVRDQRGTRAN